MEDAVLTAKVIAWAKETLESLGYNSNKPSPETIVNTPWSHVMRFDTSCGYVYLKHMPSMISLEPFFFQALQKHCQAPVPTVIEKNKNLNCFLMKDAGHSLRATLKEHFDINLFSKAINEFVSLQKASSNHIQALLSLGVLDYRLDKLPILYDELITNKSLIIQEGLSNSEISQLKRLSGNIHSLCQKLSTYPVPATIVQPDFSDNNMLFDPFNNTITVIDLGEIVISHPFFSLLNCLYQANKHYSIDTNDERYPTLFDSCFKKYKQVFSSEEEFLDALNISKTLRSVYDLIYQTVFIEACGKESLLSFGHYSFGESLHKFIKSSSKSG